MGAGSGLDARSWPRFLLTGLRNRLVPGEISSDSNNRVVSSSVTLFCEGVAILLGSILRRVNWKSGGGTDFLARGSAGFMSDSFTLPVFEGDARGAVHFAGESLPGGSVAIGGGADARDAAVPPMLALSLVRLNGLCFDA